MSLTVREKQQRAGSAEGCPEIERHTAFPRGYVAWHVWANRMSRTHKQERCPRCGFWAIWVPKPGIEEVDDE